MSHPDEPSTSPLFGRGAAIERALAPGLSDQLPASLLTTAPARSFFCGEDRNPLLLTPTSEAREALIVRGLSATFVRRRPTGSQSGLRQTGACETIPGVGLNLTCLRFSYQGEVVTRLHVRNEPWPDGLPAEQRASLRARCRLVTRETHAERAELIGRRRCRRQVQLAADYFSHFARGYGLVTDGVPDRSSWSLLDRQAEELSRVQNVHGWPAAGAVTDIAGDSLLARGRDQPRDKAVYISLTVHRPRQAHNRRADA